jgi:glycine cleavage system H protein
MKELHELHLPDIVRYAEDHEWATMSGDTVKIGVSDYAQDQLGDIVYVEMPEPGETFARGETFGTLESVKAVSELYMPMAGEVVAVNEALADGPELINEDPYAGWIIEIRPSDPTEYDRLMSAQAYLAMLEE